MQQSLEKLRKFFRLEHENGYSNSAIIGGLAKMLDYWEGDARADKLQEEVIQAVVQRLPKKCSPRPQTKSRDLLNPPLKFLQLRPTGKSGSPARHPRRVLRRPL